MDEAFGRAVTVQPTIYKVIYRSKLTEEGGHDQVMENIKRILEWSRSWNPKHGITGALMLDEDGFAQVLEGPSHSVKSLFGHIVCDRRHKDVQVMEADFHPERDFANWSMAFVGKQGEADVKLAATPQQSQAATGGGGKAVIEMLRWFLQEQP